MRSCSWSDLIDNTSAESTLASDLLDTIGSWGVHSLTFRKPSNMNNASQTKNAAAMFGLLVSVAKRSLNLLEKKYRFDVQSSKSDDSAYFGINIPHGVGTLARLQQIAGGNGDWLGWFGYSAEANGATTLDVWIYCAPDQPETGANVLSYAKKQLRTAPDKTTVENIDRHIRISVPGNTGKSDDTWFHTILTALKDTETERQ